MASLAVLRRRALLSQRDLAKRAGVAPSSVHLIERGRTRPRVAVMRKLASALGIADPMQVDEFRRVLTGDELPTAAPDWDEATESADVLDADSDPVLAALWDNEEDAVYDTLALTLHADASA